MNRKQRLTGLRERKIICLTEYLEYIDKAMQKAGVPLSEKEDFLNWLIDSSWSLFKEERMKKRMAIEEEIGRLDTRLPNGTVNKEYSASFTLPVEKISDVTIHDTDKLGLSFSIDENGVCSLRGIPVQTGDFLLKLSYRTITGEPDSELSLPIAFNPDPRTLWNDIPTDKTVIFYKEDNAWDRAEDMEMNREPGSKCLIAASKRGRSHAREGKPRDDDFRICYCEESNWYIIAVADGAGSARFSRKGSEIACETVVDYCRKLLQANPDFEHSIREFEADRHNKEKRLVLTRKVIEIVYNGALKAHKAVKEFAESGKDTAIKDFATTLMFVVCKRFDFGWFIASFWVGDGAICILDTVNRTAKLLGTPDEGEFSGQTRFLTMQEIFRDPEVVAKRLRMAIVKDFTALFLMTDGVSDPMFGSESSLNSYEKWNEFFQRLKTGFPEDGVNGVDLTSPDAERQLLEWLGFWSQGNHDDRTIAVLH